MVFIEFSEFLLALLIFVFFLFQVIIPIWNGTVLFPFFRKKAKELANQLQQARTDVELSKEEKKLKDLKGKLNDSETNL